MVKIQCSRHFLIYKIFTVLITQNCRVISQFIINYKNIYKM